MYENWIWVGETDPPATTEGEHWIGPRDLQNCELSEAVNSGTELMPGAACTSELSFVLWNAPEITSGTRLVYFQKQGESLVRIGTFTADKPTKQTKSTNKVLAYDAMAKTEKDLSDWLRSIQDKFPIALMDFAKQVCEQCGLELVNESIPNGDYQIQQFYSDGMTGRQLLVWVGQACGRFCRATPDGKLEFAWYEDRGWRSAIGAGEDGQMLVRLAGDTLRVADRDPAAPPEGPEIYRIPFKQHWYYADGLSFEDYETAGIDKVQIRQSESDVGVIVPPEGTGTNALVIANNLLLTTEDDASLRPVAEVLFEQFKSIRYTPCKVTLTADCGIRAGDIVTVKDANGKSFISYIMSAKTSGGRVTLESTGSATRTASTAVNYSVQRNLRGKMLEIESSVDGLRVKASELSGDYAELSLAVDGISSTVEANKKETDEQLGEVETQLRTEIKQTVEGLTLEASSFTSEDLFAGATWTNGTTVTNDGSDVQVGTGLYVPDEKLNSLSGKTITFSIEVKAQSETIDGTWVNIWTNYSSGNVNTHLATNTQIAAAKDWTKLTATIHLKDETPTRIYLWAYVYQGYSGSFSVRNATAYIRDNQSSKLTLKSGETTLSSADITLAGVVTFQNLANEGETVINGSNITTGELNADLIKTGTIQNRNGTTRYDLDSGTIQMGADDAPHIFIDNEMIRWYTYMANGKDVGPTGIFYSVYGNTWIGATSRHVYMGWISEGKPVVGNDTHWYGVHIDNSDHSAKWNVGDLWAPKIDCGGDLGVGNKISTRYFEAWGSKDRVVPTGYGVLGIAAMESPAPAFCDFGGGVCDADGVCCIALDERYLAVTEPKQRRRWVLTDTDGLGPLWVEDGPAGALVHGTPGQRFDWLCLAAQKGTGGEYAEVRDTRPPWLEPQIPDLLTETQSQTEFEENEIQTQLMEVLSA